MNVVSKVAAGTKSTRHAHMELPADMRHLGTVDVNRARKQEEHIGVSIIDVKSKAL